VVKDTLLSHIRDKLCFSHKDVLFFKGLKKAVLRINNDFWKRQQEDKNKFQIAQNLQNYMLKPPELDMGRVQTLLEIVVSCDRLVRKKTRLPVFSTPTFSCSDNPPSLISNILGSNDYLIPVKQ